MIKKIKGEEILDSRGNPTIEVQLTTDFGVFRASVPSGASTGKYEAKELRDGGDRYSGKGVKKAIENIEKIISPELIDKDPSNQKEIDNLMIKLDGTKDKSKLGANAILAVSMAVCRAGAGQTPLYKYISQLAGNDSFKMPKPAFNIINGGVHAGSELDFQEFMIVPEEKSFSENLRTGSEVYHNLKESLKKKFGSKSINLGDEGGFVPPFVMAEQVLDFILKIKDIKIIIDVAASEFYDNEKYKMNIGVFNKDGLARYYLDLINKYPIIGIEDPFSEDDWEGWKILNSQLKKSKTILITDDLTATNKDRLRKAVKEKCANGIIIKPNQIGTITEAIQTVKLAKSSKWKVMVSHRSGETSDDFIADFAVGVGADLVKFGAPARGERVVKYNRLLQIENN